VEEKWKKEKRVERHSLHSITTGSRKSSNLHPSKPINSRERNYPSRIRGREMSTLEVDWMQCRRFFEKIEIEHLICIERNKNDIRGTTAKN
jgi:hypothetical protein